MHRINSIRYFIKSEFVGIFHRRGAHRASGTIVQMPQAFFIGYSTAHAVLLRSGRPMVAPTSGLSKHLNKLLFAYHLRKLIFTDNFNTKLIGFSQLTACVFTCKNAGCFFRNGSCGFSAEFFDYCARFVSCES